MIEEENKIANSTEFTEVNEIQGSYVGTYKSKSLAMILVPNGLKIIAMCCLSLVFITTLLMIFVPWQQSISGRGKVIIFSPMERPQHLEAPIPGRIKEWFVRDGQIVKKGEKIIELEEVDSKFLAPNQFKQMHMLREAMVDKKEAAQAKACSLSKQMKSLALLRKASVSSAGGKQKQTHDKLDAAAQAVKAAEQNLKTAELNFVRRKELYEKGLRSKRDFELSELTLVQARTSLERAQATLEVASKETSVAGFELSKADADVRAKIDSIEASYNSAMETVATTEAGIHKLDIEISHLKSRMTQRILISPCEGRVVRLLKAGAGETVKSGASLAIIATQTNDLAVELIVEGNDAPLISPGRPVRLQFAGWPAVQFTGWPSVAVGTFAGRVSVVDAVDDGTGKFRIIVVPDEEAVKMHKDEPWPNTRYLRPGSDVHGWVMLNTVSLGFELWRQFNAFPPSIDHSKTEFKSGDIKRKSKLK